MKLALALTLLLLTYGATHAQQTIFSTEPLHPKQVSSWVAKQPQDYAGVYHFGVSEAESDFVLCVDSGLITAQVQTGSFTPNGDQWVRRYENLRNVRIVGNKFFSDQTNGEFITFPGEDGARVQGLRVFRPWSLSVPKGQYEAGARTAALATYFDTPGGVASYRLLTPAELQGRSKADLALLRNGIFARYGFIFTKGGAMEQHFRQQPWYSPQHRDVSVFLTEIEKRNIELLRKLESTL